MRRALGLLALLATGGLIIAPLWLVGTLPQDVGSGRIGLGRLGIEPASFVAGVATAILLARLLRLPWGRLVEALAALGRIWRRNAAMLALAAVFAGILLFY